MHKIGRFQIYFILALALLINLTVLDHIKICGAKPDLMIIPVIFFGLFLGRGPGLESGIAAGLAKDLFALDFFGINALVLGLTGFIAGVLGAKFSRESKRTQFLLVIFMTALSMSLHFILATTFSKLITLGFGEYLYSSIIPTCIYTALISIPILSRLIGTYQARGSEDYL